MSNSPIIPANLSDSAQWKKFWSSWEGLTGGLLLLLLVGFAIFAWGTVSAFLVAMLADTVHMVGLGFLLFGMLWLAFSKRSHMLFRLVSRYLTGIIINLDPVGIAEDKILQMKERRSQFAEQITNVAGQKRSLQDIIEQNKVDADKNLKFAAQAQKMAQTTDAQKAIEMQLQMKAKARKAGRLEESNIGYQTLLDYLTKLYNLLSLWAVNMDYFIEDTEDEVKQKTTRYKVTNAAWTAIKTGMKIIKGDATENDFYDRAMAKLAEDASQKLGYIEDFQRVAQDFMNTIDIQNGVVDTAAMEKLNQYEQKLLTAGDEQTTFLIPAITQQAVPVPAKSAKTRTYGDLLKQ
jgi:hypothetical protein